MRCTAAGLNNGLASPYILIQAIARVFFFVIVCLLFFLENNFLLKKF